MDELATTVSDILNQAANGVGDISAWLASDGLAGYAAVCTVQSAEAAIMSLLLLAASAVCTYRCIKIADEDVVSYAYRKRGDTFAVVALISGSIAIVSAFVFFASVYDLCGWLASPDGMLLKTLVDGLMAK